MMISRENIPSIKEKEVFHKKAQWLRSGWKVTMTLALTVSFLLALGLIFAEGIWAGSAREIDIRVDVYLDRCYKEVKGATELAKNAKGCCWRLES